MGEDSFFNGLFHVMWNMETDIFSEKEKTLGLLADIVPKCKKQRKRVEAMYDCGAMELIEKAVADREHYVLNMKRAVRLLIEEMHLSCEKALFSVNQIAELWDGDLEIISDYDENEDLDNVDDNTFDNGDIDEGKSDSSGIDENNSQEKQSGNEDNSADEEQALTEENSVTDTINSDKDKDEKDGEEDMIFLQEIAEEESAEVQEENSAEAQEEDGGEEQPQPPRESILKKIIQFWCKSDFEDGRPYMIACPIGWILIILSSMLGAFMIYDIPLGDKFVVPTFALIFSVLTSKRLYRYESTGRFSLLVGAFYIVAMGRVMWLGKGYPPIACVPMVLAALIVFNSGRIGTLLDEAKNNSFFAYIIISFFSAAITVGAYAIQRVEF